MTEAWVVDHVRGSGDPYVVLPDGVEVFACERGPRSLTEREAALIALAPVLRDAVLKSEDECQCCVAGSCTADHALADRVRAIGLLDG